MGAHTNPFQDQFQEEVLRVFALEASEWIKHINAAFTELEGGTASERSPNLFETILRDLTNLKSSAATVHLTAVEQMAVTLVPIFQSIQETEFDASSEPCVVLRQSLDSLTAAIQALAMAETKTAVVPDLERIMQRSASPATALLSKDPTRRMFQVTPDQMKIAREEKALDAQPTVIIEALLKLKQAPSPSSEFSRNLVEVILRKAHGVVDQYYGVAWVSEISRIMESMAVLDGRFLEEAQQRLAAITKIMEDLKAGGAASGAQKRMRMAIRETAFLYESARAVDATAIVQFLHGLETLLTGAAYLGIPLNPQRVDLVVSRLSTLLPLAQKWVEAGRAEREAIEKALAQFMSADSSVSSMSSSSTGIMVMKNGGATTSLWGLFAANALSRQRGFLSPIETV